jgi:hypothetical protein
MINEGTYTAKINNYGLYMAQSGNMVCTIRFKTPNDEFVNWSGVFGSEKATERTMNTLELFGFVTYRAADLALGRDANVLDLEKEVEIVVVHETNESGKTFPKVQYVNDLNKFATCSKEEAVRFFSNFKLADKVKALKLAKGETPKPYTHTSTTPGVTVETTSFDDIPF